MQVRFIISILKQVSKAISILVFCFIIGYCQSFETDGVNDYGVIISDWEIQNATGAITIEFWIKLLKPITGTGHEMFFGGWLGGPVPGATGAIEDTDGGDPSENLSGYISWIWWTTSWDYVRTSLTTNHLFPVNEWKYFTLTRGESGLHSSVKMYVNGKEIAITVQVDSHTSPIVNTADLRILGDGGGSWQAAKIAHIKIYKRERNTQQIIRDMNCGLPEKSDSEGLIYYNPMRDFLPTNTANKGANKITFTGGLIVADTPPIRPMIN